MKQKLILIFTVIILCCAKSFGQNDWWGQNFPSNSYTTIDYNIHAAYPNGCRQTVYIELTGMYVNIKTQETLVQLTMYKRGCNDWFSLTLVKPYNEKSESCSRIKYGNKIIQIKNNRDYFDSGLGWNARDNEKIRTEIYFNGVLPLNPETLELTFNFAPCEITNIKWDGLDNETIKKYYGFDFYTNWTETSVKQFADSHNDGICGIYGYSSNKYGCVKEDDGYKLIWFGTTDRPGWNMGNCQAFLHPSAAENTYKADYIENDFSLNNNKYVVFDGREMKIGSASYIKTYPVSGNGNNIASGGNNRNNGNSGSNTPDNFSGGWSGSGFALNKGYLATNYHVVEGASVIKVFGVKGNFNVGYNAKVIITDKVNDLAVLKIDDSRFQGFGTIPYRVKTSMAEVGESCFVLGYPMTMTMGSEVKLTTGVISARSGFQGDVSLYQISAPIQPGNSGGPCFDNSGNLVGVVNAKHRGAENVSYAIKASYLQNLVESSDVSGLLPQNNTISGYALQGKVKSIKNFVYYIRCK